MILSRIPPSHARRLHWPLKGVTCSRLSARRMTHGGRPVTLETATVRPGSSPQSSCMKGDLFMLLRHSLFQQNRTEMGTKSCFVSAAFYRRVALQRPRALFQPRPVKPPGEEPVLSINSPHLKSIKQIPNKHIRAPLVSRWEVRGYVWRSRWRLRSWVSSTALLGCTNFLCFLHMLRRWGGRYCLHLLLKNDLHISKMHNSVNSYFVANKLV